MSTLNFTLTENKHYVVAAEQQTKQELFPLFELRALQSERIVDSVVDHGA